MNKPDFNTIQYLNLFETIDYIQYIDNLQYPTNKNTRVSFKDCVWDLIIEHEPEHCCSGCYLTFDIENYIEISKNYGLACSNFLEKEYPDEYKEDKEWIVERKLTTATQGKGMLDFCKGLINHFGLKANDNIVFYIDY